MALIIEDGSNVAGANSYVTLVEARAFANARPVEPLPIDDDELEKILISAMDYLESKRSEYQGIKTTSSQPLQFPRYGLYVDCVESPSDEIPIELKNAQCQLALEINSGVDLFPTASGQKVSSETVDVISVDYEKGSSDTRLNMTKVDSYLNPLFSACGGSQFTTVRV